MDSDGFKIQGRRGVGGGRESTRDRNLDTFHRDIHRYAGTAEDFNRAHTRDYGRHEHLGPDGSHPGPGKPRFPRGSERERMHAGYTVSTTATKAARLNYNDGVQGANAEFSRMTREEKDYYKQISGGLRPDQHERLEGRAGKWASSSYNMATGRENFLRAFPHGYHSLDDQNEHYAHAEHAYGEYAQASGHRDHHADYSSSRIDTRRDRYGRPVSSRDRRY